MQHTETEKACPDFRQYQRLASGQLSDIDKEALLVHLETCGACAQKLKTLPEQDTLVGMLRQADTVDEGTSKGTIAQLVERLSKLRPGQAPAGSQATAAPVKPENNIEHGPAGPATRATYDFLAPPQQPDELGRLGPYRVLEVLGAGVMGVVFRAEDPQLARLVALKAMLPGCMTSDSARQRFLREARASAAIKHDHIVAIYQVGEDRGILFLAMELLEGEALDARLQREGKLPVAEVLRIGRQIALALAAAHKRDLIHRDIKPANIWLEMTGELGASATGARVKILDFGLARTTADQAQLTQQGAIIGTPAYMAPEQGTGKDVDPRCDLFSLGCVLYRMATGEAPFRGTDVISTLVAVATETPRSPQVLEPGLPKALSELIVRLLAKEPADRPASGQVVAETLDRIAQEGPRPAPAKKTRRWWPAAGIAAALAAVLIGLWAGGVFRLRTPDGILIVEVNEAKPDVFVDGDKMIVTWDQGGKKATIRVKPGTRKVEVKVMKEGFGIVSEFVEIEEGGRTIFTARLDRESLPAKTAGALPSKYKNSLGMEFALVPKGKAWLGGGGAKVGDKEVEFKDDFYLGVYEVTQEEWEKVTGQTPSHFSRTGPGKDAVKAIADADLKRFPVESVSWDDAQLFLERLNKQERETGWIYRLPKEAEWEYACRGGPLSDKFDSAFDFYFAKPTNQMLPEQANFNNVLKRPCKVGSYKPNQLGLYDMHGNVWEWCDDSDKAVDGVLPRVRRGGGWLHDFNSCLAAFRGGAYAPSARNINHGLRVARVPVGMEDKTKFTNSLGMEFALVPKGKAWLGGGGGKPGTKEVEFKDDFYLGVYEVTQEEWAKVTGAEQPSEFSRGGRRKDVVKDISDADLKRFPVENISWDEAQLFLTRLNARDNQAGWVYRLPTEAQWEYACRGGPYCHQIESAFDYYLDKPTNRFHTDDANFRSILGRTCKVGSYKPNRLGLYDMHGNVCEWCDDSEKGKDGALHWTYRGGCWLNEPEYCRALSHYAYPPSHRESGIGLRVARVRVGTETTKDSPPPIVTPPRPSAAFEALLRDKIPPEALKLAGGGDPKKAPASLVAVLGEAQPIHTDVISSVAFS